MSIYIQADERESYSPIYPELEGFEIVSHYIPSNWGIQIDEYGAIDMMPRSWMYGSFPEDITEVEPKAVELFHKEAKIIYEEEYAYEKNCKTRD